MKILSNLLRTIIPVSIHGNADIVVMSIEHDSRKCIAHSLFIAIKGTTNDGHRYIETAIDNGASSIICEYLPEFLHENVTYIIVHNCRESAADIAHEFYDNPSRKLKIIGVIMKRMKKMQNVTSMTMTALELFKFISISYIC